MDSVATVVVIGDVHEIYGSLSDLVAAGELTLLQCPTARDAIDSCEPRWPGCFVLDQMVGDMSGLEVWRILYAKGCRQPFVYVLRQPDVTMAVEAMRQGAVDCLVRPLEHHALRRCVRQALVRDADCRRHHDDHVEVLARVESLTPRERQVLELVAAGDLTKTIARRLNISPKTVEVYRSNILRKMRVSSAAELLHLTARYGLFPFSRTEPQRAPGWSADVVDGHSLVV
jgi:FixJ family two-component response regulator